MFKVDNKDIRKTPKINNKDTRTTPMATHERTATQMNDTISNGMDIPKWMTTRKPILCQKDPGNRNAVVIIIGQFHVLLSCES